MAVSSGTTIPEGLAIVTGTGWLTIFQIRLLETTCLYVCCESRRQVGRKVRVEAKTPRSLWHGGGSNSSTNATSGGAMPGKRSAASGPAASGSSRSAYKFSWHGSNSNRDTSAPSAPTGAATPVAPTPTTAPAASAAAPPAASPMPPPASPTGTPSRVPSIRCVRIDWLLPVAELLSSGFLWPRGVKEIRFGPLFEDGIEQLVFPETLEILTFGFRFNRSLGPGSVRWPPGLKRLRLGATWNRILSGARNTWPASLEVLEFGTGFNRPLQGGDGVGFPPGLREINLGGVFNEPLAGVEWPSGLQELTLSEYFDQPLEFKDGGGGVSFPRGLRRIVFGGRFNQEVSSTVWPEDLEVLAFGDKFNRPFVPPSVESRYTAAAGGGGGGGGGSVGRRPAPAPTPPPIPPRSFALPARLKTLVLGDDYDQPMGGGELPDSLEKLVIGESFSFVASVRWPAGLKRLELSCRWGGGGGVGGGGGNRAPPNWVTLPPRLEYLDVGDGFNSPLDNIAFSASLKVLVLGAAFDHPIDHTGIDLLAEINEAQSRGLRQRRPPSSNLKEALDHRPAPILPDGLEELRIGKAFNRDIETARLPNRLKRLVFSLDSQFDRPVASVVWPAGLEELRFGNCFDQRVEAGGGGGFEGDGGGGFDDGGGGGGVDHDSALMLPAGLRELSFGWSFSHSLQGLVLPRGLRRLSFAPRYPMSHVRGLEWPPSLQCIVVGSFALRSREEVFKWVSQPPF
eukprot:g12994.t1